MPETPPINGQANDEPVPDGQGSSGDVFASGGAITEVAIDTELAGSYLTYAMSTIVDRALPDVRDGLKPSQRRILVAMHDLNLVPTRKHSKCAGVTGEVMKKYHPHGEQAIYPTLVNMAQEWKMRYLLIDKQGNFGSIDPDPPAAMRYTECRLHRHALEMLEDLDLATVDWQPNFDESCLEPTCLPARFPNLLVNGSTGIAVGMASAMPPHNLGEICDAIVATLDNPSIRLEELIRHVPAPDFPTGGILCGRRGVLEAYHHGRGRLVLRARIHHEQKGNRDLLVVTEIPYQVSKNDGIIAKIVECRKEDRITDIYDVVDESSNRGGMRLVIELKKGADPVVVENQLYELTPLQSSFSVMNIALVRGQPRTLGLKELLQLYIDHRVEVVRRRTAFRLRRAQQEAHRIEGLIYAVCDIDEVIRLIRASSTRDQAIERLMARGFRIPPTHPQAPKIPARLLAQSAQNEVKLSRIQAEAIGRMQLIQLVGLEIDKLVDEYTKLVAQIEDYESILASATRVTKIIRDETLELKTKYGDKRRTEIREEVGDFNLADLTAEEQVAVTISHAGYVKRTPVETFRTQGRGGKGVIGAEVREGDFTEQMFVSSTHDDLLCFTNTGRVYRIKVYEIPEAPRTSRGRAIVNLLQLKDGERVCEFMAIQGFEKQEVFLCFATARGVVKRTPLADYRNVNQAGIIAVNLRPGDSLIGVTWTGGDDHLLLATRRGMAIRFHEDDVRAMGRAASGVKGIELAGVEDGPESGNPNDEVPMTNGQSAKSDAEHPAGPAGPSEITNQKSAVNADSVVGLVRVLKEDPRDLLTVTAKGYGKRTPLAEYLVHSEDGSTRVQSRGGKGRKDISVTGKNGEVVGLLAIEPDQELMLIATGGNIVRIQAGTVRQTNRGSQGVRVIDLNEGESLAGVAPVVVDEDQGTEG